MNKLNKLSILTLIAQLCACSYGNQQSEPLAENQKEGFHYIAVEAENADLREPFQVGQKASGTGEEFIWVPNHATKLTFSVTESGTYKIWGRVFCAHGAEDSFNLTIDEGDPFNWNNIAHHDTWHWDDVQGKEGPMTFELKAGQHTLTLMPRESNSKLDRILVTNDVNYTPEGNPEEGPVQEKEYVWMEAETGEITPPFYVLPHHKASGGSYIAVPEERTRVKVNIPQTDTYRIFMKVYAEAGDQNSIKLKVGDRYPKKNWNAIPVEHFGEWVWDEVDFGKQEAGAGGFNLEAGEISLWINYREEGLKIDKILITNDMDYKPSENNV